MFEQLLVLLLGSLSSGLLSISIPNCFRAVTLVRVELALEIIDLAIPVADILIILCFSVFL
jgi:hypothetical protein